MKNLLPAALAALAVLAAFPACDEWDPVLEPDYEVVEPYEPSSMLINTFISELKELYKGVPVKIQNDMVIGGRIISEDRSGNVYRSFYIQDVTGAIEIKIGKSALYNDYKIGQQIYVKCAGLTLGSYGGMLQLGLEDPSGEYETAYIDIQYLIDTHIFRGDPTDIRIPEPTPMTEADLKAALLRGRNSPYWGKCVTIKGLKYANEVFVLLYLDNNANKKLSSNRVFLSDKQWGITTWAMSKSKYLEYLRSGVWDSAKVGNSGDQNYGTVADYHEELEKNAGAYTLSQYFKLGATSVQIRTSGYARFADTELDAAILGGAPIDVTGILTLYDNAAQITLLDIDGVSQQ